MPAVTPTPTRSALLLRPQFLQCPACRRLEPRPADFMRRMSQGRWRECCGRLMVPAFDVAAAPPADDTPWADRRLADRRPPRYGARVQVRRGGLVVGPDVAVELLDVSTGGARVRVRPRLHPGDRVVVTLVPPGGALEAGGPAEVRWSAAAADGSAEAGLQFRHPLTDRQMAELTE